ncbi:hypothetical protein BB560_001985 [Smittium megazygosporum]|uniref:HotDog ACOT-type domain-containing protein n=1 Tax=Smittium megazygosporum TaxID=133381 RepID=A0A2T9ZFZ3_9FUNG|nr:hypothetical protein BB560_001985 [Smittium megazygosporum]
MLSTNSTSRFISRFGNKSIAAPLYFSRAFSASNAFRDPKVKTQLNQAEIPELETKGASVYTKMKQWEQILGEYTNLPKFPTDAVTFLNKLNIRVGESDFKSDHTFEYSPDTLTIRSMKDSYTELALPFKDDSGLLEDFIEFSGVVKIGKILETLDHLSVAVSYKHCGDDKGRIPNITIVTASVDRIDILDHLSSDANYKVSGFVSYVGYSSIEVSLKLDKVLTASENPNTNNSEAQKHVPVLYARFTMVARDKQTGKAVQVNPLKIESEKERRLSKITEENKYNIDFQQTDFVWLDSTDMSSFNVCFPQERNIHNKIFGGFLMRKGHELAFANACMFSKELPSTKSLDNFSFSKPVNVGSILRLTSQIVYSSEASSENKKTIPDFRNNLQSFPAHHALNSFQVAVKADVLDPSTQSIQNTNTFHFTFETKNPIRRIIPRTYEDMMKYIEGRRRNNIGDFISQFIE